MSTSTTTTDVQYGGDVAMEDLVAQAERAVLGAFMRSVAAYERAAALLSGADFMDPKHERIWGTISYLVSQGSPGAPMIPDVTLVAAPLLELGTLGDCAGAGYLARLVTELATTQNAAYHARIVKDATKQRAIAVPALGQA